jgi:hypothetical protein
MQTEEKSLEEFVKQITFLDSKDQVRLFRMWMNRVKEDVFVRTEIYSITASANYPMARVERWMAKRFRKNFNSSPKRMAYECTYYMRLDKRMEPLLRKIARKVKARVRYHLKYKKGAEQNLRIGSRAGRKRLQKFWDH